MPRLKRPTENHKQVMNCGLVIASMSMTISKVAQEMLDLDPNEWYGKYLFYLDRLTTTAEVLQDLWSQNHEQLEHMSLELPSYMIAVKADPKESLEEVFKEMLRSTSEDTNGGVTPISIDDLPF